MPQEVPNIDAEADEFLRSLSQAVHRRICPLPAPHTRSTIRKCILANDVDMLPLTGARVGVLFSGGIDSLMLAMLAARELKEDEPIEYVVVPACFIGIALHRGSW